MLWTCSSELLGDNADWLTVLSISTQTAGDQSSGNMTS